MNRSITYNIPSFNVEHNKIIVDVYKDSTFIYNETLPPGEHNFTIENCECFSRYFIEVTPVNFESYYEVMFESENVLFIDKDFASQCSVKNCEVNGNQYQLNTDRNININSFKTTDYISIPIHYSENFPLNNNQTAIDNLHVDIFNNNNELIESMDLKNKNTFSFTKNNETRNYKADCILELVNSEKIYFTLNIKYPEFKLINLTHRCRPSDLDLGSYVIDFNFLYNRNPLYMIYKVYEDRERTKLIKSERHDDIHFLKVDIKKGSHMFFTFDLYDNLGLVYSKQCKKDFDFTRNIEM